MIAEISRTHVLRMYIDLSRGVGYGSIRKIIYRKRLQRHVESEIMVEICLERRIIVHIKKWQLKKLSDRKYSTW